MDLEQSDKILEAHRVVQWAKFHEDNGNLVKAYDMYLKVAADLSSCINEHDDSFELLSNVLESLEFLQTVLSRVVQNEAIGFSKDFQLQEEFEEEDVLKPTPELISSSLSSIEHDFNNAQPEPEPEPEDHDSRDKKKRGRFAKHVKSSKSGKKGDTFTISDEGDHASSPTRSRGPSAVVGTKGGKAERSRLAKQKKRGKKNIQKTLLFDEGITEEDIMALDDELEFSVTTDEMADTVVIDDHMVENNVVKVLSSQPAITTTTTTTTTTAAAAASDVRDIFEEVLPSVDDMVVFRMTWIAINVSHKLEHIDESSYNLCKEFLEKQFETSVSTLEPSFVSNGPEWKEVRTVFGNSGTWSLCDDMTRSLLWLELLKDSFQDITISLTRDDSPVIASALEKVGWNKGETLQWVREELVRVESTLNALKGSDSASPSRSPSTTNVDEGRLSLSMVLDVYARSFVVLRLLCQRLQPILVSPNHSDFALPRKIEVITTCFAAYWSVPPYFRSICLLPLVLSVPAPSKGEFQVPRFKPAFGGKSLPALEPKRLAFVKSSLEVFSCGRQTGRFIPLSLKKEFRSFLKKIIDDFLHRISYYHFHFAPPGGSCLLELPKSIFNEDIDDDDDDEEEEEEEGNEMKSPKEEITKPPILVHRPRGGISEAMAVVNTASSLLNTVFDLPSRSSRSFEKNEIAIRLCKLLRQSSATLYRLVFHVFENQQDSSPIGTLVKTGNAIDCLLDEDASFYAREFRDHLPENFAPIFAISAAIFYSIAFPPAVASAQATAGSSLTSEHFVLGMWLHSMNSRFAELIEKKASVAIPIIDVQETYNPLLHQWAQATSEKSISWIKQAVRLDAENKWRSEDDDGKGRRSMESTSLGTASLYSSSLVDVVAAVSGHYKLIKENVWAVLSGKDFLSLLGSTFAGLSEYVSLVSNVLNNQISVFVINSGAQSGGGGGKTIEVVGREICVQLNDLAALPSRIEDQILKPVEKNDGEILEAFSIAVEDIAECVGQSVKESKTSLFKMVDMLSMAFRGKVVDFYLGQKVSSLESSVMILEDSLSVCVQWLYSHVLSRLLLRTFVRICSGLEDVCIERMSRKDEIKKLVQDLPSVCRFFHGDGLGPDLESLESVAGMLKQFCSLVVADSNELVSMLTESVKQEEGNRKTDSIVKILRGRKDAVAKKAIKALNL